jgi:O-antigen/teichoic acid export membrane protein
MLKKLSSGHWPIFLLSSLSSIGNLFLPLFLVRLLTTEDIGIYKIFFLHLSAIPFIVMAGGPVHSVYYWSGKEGQEKQDYLNATWTLTLMLSAIVLIVGLPMRNYLSGALGLSVEYVTIMLFTGFLICPSSHYSEATIASGKTLRGSLFGTIGEVIKALGFILIATQTGDLYWVIIFYAVFLVIKLSVGAYYNHKINQVALNTDWAHIKKVLIYCLPISFTGCLGFFIDKIDLLILSGKLETTSFAYYSMGCLVIPPLYLLEMSVQKTLIPNISRSYLQKDWAAGAVHFRKSIADIAFLIIPGLLGLFTFAGPIVSILYTDKFIDSVPYLQIFAFSYLLLIFPHDSIPRATGKSAWILKIYCTITIISLTTVWLATNWVDTKTILMISVGLKFIPKFWGLRFSKQIMNWTWRDMFPLQKLLCYSILSVALSVGSFLVKGLFKNDLTWFLVCGSIFAGIYLGLVLTYGKKLRDT